MQMPDTNAKNLDNAKQNEMRKKHSFFWWEINEKTKDLLDFRYNTQEEIDKLNEEMTTTEDLDNIINKDTKNIEEENEEIIRKKDDEDAELNLNTDLQEIEESMNNKIKENDKTYEGNDRWLSWKEIIEDKNLKKNFEWNDNEDTNQNNEKFSENNTIENEKPNENNNEKDNKFFDPFELSLDEDDENSQEWDNEIFDPFGWNDDENNDSDETVEDNEDENKESDELDNSPVDEPKDIKDKEENDRENYEDKEENDGENYDNDGENEDKKNDVEEELNEEDENKINDNNDEEKDENEGVYENDSNENESDENEKEDEIESDEENDGIDSEINEISEIDDTNIEIDNEENSNEEDNNEGEQEYEIREENKEDNEEDIEEDENRINENEDDDENDEDEDDENDEDEDDGDNVIIHTPIMVTPNKKDEREESIKNKKAKKNSATGEVVTDEEIQLEQWQNIPDTEDDEEYQPSAEELFEREPEFFADDELSQQFMHLVQNVREIFKLERRDWEQNPYFKILWWKTDNSTLEYLFYLIEDEDEPIDLYIKKVETNQETGEESEHLVQFSYNLDKELDIFVDEIILYESINKSDINSPEFNDTKSILEKFIFLTDNHYDKLKSELNKLHEERQKKRQLQQIFKGF